LLYKSNVLLYDRETDSLWSQVIRKAVTGKMTGKELKTLPFSTTTWKKWLNKYPNTEVLSLKTGHSRDYSRDPYEDYYGSSIAFFDQSATPPHLPEKELIYGIEVNGKHRAYPMSKLRKLKKPQKESFAGTDLIVTYESETDTTTVKDGKGNKITGLMTYWFVWYDFHKETSIFGVSIPHKK